jgi:hypothetical protein
MRRYFFEAWRKYRGNLPLEPLEAQIVQVIAIHPEYHGVVEDEDNIDRDYTPEEGKTNPFMHMGMHLALRDQSLTDQPAGVREVYVALMQKFGGDHEAEHQMMECLSEMLWTAQRNGSEPDVEAYLNCLRARAGA